MSQFRAWSEPDRALALALQQHEDSLCQGCGQPVHESMDKANQRNYFVDIPSRCHACTAISRRMHQYDDAQHASALRFGAQLVKPATKT